MNYDVSINQIDGDSSFKDSEPFRKQYAAVLIQLNEANEQVYLNSETCIFIIFGVFPSTKFLISNSGAQSFSWGRFLLLYIA